MENTNVTLDQFHEAHKRLHPGEIVLDVRNPEEWAAGHVPGSLNIPLPQLPSRWEELKSHSRIYIYCKKGGRAKSARDLLATAGFTNLACLADAGMDHWVEAGFPVER